jgi:hypothetical protein
MVVAAWWLYYETIDRDRNYRNVVSGRFQKDLSYGHKFIVDSSICMCVLSPMNCLLELEQHKLYAGMDASTYAA